MENSKEEKKTIIELVDKGPLKIKGDFTIVGYEQVKNQAAICRCGETKTPPFCSGAHTALTTGG